MTMRRQAPVALELDDAKLTDAAAALIDAARRRVDAELQAGPRIPAFVESHYALAWRVLSAIAVARIAPGRRFVEWGSGAGVVSCLAVLAGFEATGVEIEPRLVAIARELAAAHAPAAQFRCDSYKPTGAYDDAVDPAELRQGFDPTDFDIVYAYPWKPEEPMIESLFCRFTPPGALLVLCRGGGDIRCYT